MLIINFHGIGEASRPMEPGEAPYWITEARFTEILDIIEAQVFDVGITFDDGNDSDALIAMPELRHRKLAASFFMLAGKIGQTGYVSSQQIAEIDADSLFTIGSHGMDHLPWPELDDAALEHELSTSRVILSEICGRPVDTAGLPFGRYDRRILKALDRHRYCTVYSSDGGPRLCAAMPLPRFSVRSDTPTATLATMMESWHGILNRTRNEAKASIKAWR